MTKAAASPSTHRFAPFLNQAAILLIAAVSLVGLILLRQPDRLAMLGWSSLVTLGAVGLWRWAWFGLHIVRWLIYQHIVFPKWRRKANRIPMEELPPVCLLVPTYKEKPWITERVFRSIALEAKTLAHPVTIVTVSSGPEEDAAIVAALRLGDPDLASLRVVHAIDPGDGKRKALADGLRAIAKLNLPENTIIALMDGDSEFTPGTLSRCLPLFNLFPKLGALTTDETPYVVGSYFFSEWFHLRFAQRHYQMCSISLSKKVLCLTGRFALYRAEACLQASFAEQLENDTLDDWLWGKFKFLSGDDKSTWYWMLKWRDYDLLYVPDVVVISIESISGSLWKRTYQNMRRWFGNMLRNGNRALALGPNRLGWFVWLCLIDQRLSMWSCLVSPTLLLFAIFSSAWLAVGLLLCWLIFSRSLTLTLLFWGRESHLKPIHLPILLLSQWASALIKIWTQMNLSKQRWFNRGDRKLSAGGNPLVIKFRESTSNFLLICQSFGFGIIMFTLLGILSPSRDLLGLWQGRTVVSQVPDQVIEAIDRGVIPNDGRDDAAVLQALINELPEAGAVQINLPIGELDLFSPIEINRSHTSLMGQGAGRTVLNAQFNSQVSRTAKAVIVVQPSGGDRATSANSASSTDLSNPISTNANSINYSTLQHVGLSKFTLRLSKSTTVPTGIVLRKVIHPFLTYINLEQIKTSALVLEATESARVEYVTTNGASTKSAIRLIDANNTRISETAWAKS